MPARMPISGPAVVGRALRGGEEEQRGLQALADHGEERHHDDRERADLRAPRSSLPRSSPAMRRAARRIQKIIQVTKTTAAIEVIASNSSRCSNVCSSVVEV